MRVHAAGAIVDERVGAPHCLIFLQEEVVISVQQMNHFYFNFGLRVGEGAKLFVFALDVLVRVGLAELGLVAAGVIDLFDLVVRKVALLVVTVGLCAKLVAVGAEISSAPVRLVVVVDAGLALVKVYLRCELPLREHGFVLCVFISNRKN